jgi:Cu-Zn family superoxide dismutase
MKISQIPSSFVAAAAILFLACVSTSRAETHPMAAAMAPSCAIAVLVPGNASGVSGTVTFTKVEGGVQVVADVKGLIPGKHGFHVHQYGDLSKADLTSTGGHFNPAGHDHAAPSETMRHAGDLGNLTADASGHATADFIDTGLELSGANSIVGRAVIIHAAEDDLKTQPTGNAGGRVAGGVIAIAKGK